MTTSLPTYTGDMTALVPLTGNALTDALLVGSKWGTGPAGTGANVTFSFPLTREAFDVRENIAGNYNPTEVTASGFANYLQGYSAFSSAAQNAARAVLATWANVANLGFMEVSSSSVDAGVLRFANTAPPGMGASTYGVSSFPQDFAGAGDTWINSAFTFPDGWSAGTQNFLTLLHEVGHALGLKHPHDAGMGSDAGWPQNPSILTFTGTDTLKTESTQSMVMAYNDIPGLSEIGGLSLQSDYAPTTPMRYDITAIQYLYGPNTTYNANDTTYIFDGNANYNMTIWDAGGSDTIVATGTRPVEIDLNADNWSKLGKPVTFSTRNADLSVAQTQLTLDDPYTVFIYDNVIIENATGGDGNDAILGNAVANQLRGGGGNDVLHGLGGTDTAVFTGSFANYQILYNRALGGATVTDKRTAGLGDGVDTLKSIEKLQFADKTFDLLNPARTENAAFGKSQSFLFDPAFYLLKNPDLVPTVTLATAFDSYKSKGAAAGAAPNAWFDPVYYANKWADLKALNLDAATLFAHYNLYGVWEGRSAGPSFDKFDGTKYLNDNPDVAAYVDAFVKDFLGSRSNGAIAHYVIYGANEGRLAYDTAGVVIEQAILILFPAVDNG
jgi:serralysin